MTKLNSVLLVDDDATTNYLNRILLTRLEVAEQLRVAGNGREALAILTGLCTLPAPECPALVLLDLNMPVMSGLEFMEAYQHLPLPSGQAPVIIVLTTSVNPQELAQVRQLPIGGVLSKPLTEAKVRDLLQTHFTQG